jgi:hypothetical protein
VTLSGTATVSSALNPQSSAPLTLSLLSGQYDGTITAGTSPVTLNAAQDMTIAGKMTTAADVTLAAAGNVSTAITFNAGVTLRVDDGNYAYGTLTIGSNSVRLDPAAGSDIGGIHTPRTNTAPAASVLRRVCALLCPPLSSSLCVCVCVRRSGDAHSDGFGR